MDMSEVPNDKELISRAVEAIQGRSDNPEIVLGQFVARYREDALRDLVGRVQSSRVRHECNGHRRSSQWRW